MAVKATLSNTTLKLRTGKTIYDNEGNTKDSKYFYYNFQSFNEKLTDAEILDLAKSFGTVLDLPDTMYVLLEQTHDLENI